MMLAKEFEGELWVKASDVQRLQRENEELRSHNTKMAAIVDNQAHELAALKSQSTEQPVAWKYMQDGLVIMITEQPPDRVLDADQYQVTSLFSTPPTATALVEGFRKRAVEVCKKLHDTLHIVGKTANYEGEYGSDYDCGYGSAAVDCLEAIESLPLINDFNQGEK